MRASLLSRSAVFGVSFIVSSDTGRTFSRVRSPSQAAFLYEEIYETIIPGKRGEVNEGRGEELVVACGKKRGENDEFTRRVAVGVEQFVISIICDLCLSLQKFAVVLR